MSDQLPTNDADWFLLLERHRRAMIRVAAKVVGRQDAEDIVGDAMLNAYTYRHTFTGDGSIEGWLVTIAKNVALKEVGDKKKRPKSLADHGPRRKDDAEEPPTEGEIADRLNKCRERFSDDPARFAERDETLAEIELNLPSDEVTAVPMAQPSVAAMMYLAALAWPETDDNGHQHRDDCLYAMAHLAERKGRALGFKSPNRLTMTAQQQANVLRGMCKRLDSRLQAARVAMFVMAGFKRPDKQPWTVGEVAVRSGKRTNWYRDVWTATLPVLHLAWRFRGVADFKRRYSKIDDDAVLDLVLDPSWIADAIAGAETLAAVLPVAKRRGDQVPFLDVPARVRLLPE